MIVTSACATRQPRVSTTSRARASRSIESAPFQAGSVSGKWVPMSPAAAAPRMASVTAWATASRIGVPVETGGMRNVLTAQDQPAAGDKAVRVVADADARHGRRRASASPAPRSSRYGRRSRRSC